jgi:hypothetical protein
VEYEWELRTAGGGKQTGKLRISSVGGKQFRGAPHRWVELKLTYDKPGQKPDRLRKLLVSEPGLRAGLSAKDVVAECYQRDGAGGRVVPLRPAHWGDLLGMGFSRPDAALRETRRKEAVRVRLGAFQARHVQTPDPADGGAMTYHGWLTPEVPFGWARFEIREGTGGAQRTLFRASAAATGSGARSELDESRDRDKR